MENSIEEKQEVLDIVLCLYGCAETFLWQNDITMISPVKLRKSRGPMCGLPVLSGRK